MVTEGNRWFQGLRGVGEVLELHSEDAVRHCEYTKTRLKGGF